MNTTNFDWLADLEMSIDVKPFDKQGFRMLIEWFNQWRVRMDLGLVRASAIRFWREQVRVKPREDWQHRQWAEALGRYLRWVEICTAQGGDARTVPERMKAAVISAGARRGRLEQDEQKLWILCREVRRMGWLREGCAGSRQGVRVADLSG